MPFAAAKGSSINSLAAIAPEVAAQYPTGNGE
jgi:hypothetical protein